MVTTFRQTFQRAVIGCAMAGGLAVTGAAAQSTSRDVTWRWTGGGTTACSVGGTQGTFTVFVDATVEVPKSEAALNVAILKDVSARAQSLGFKNGTAVFSLSADVVPAPPANTGRGRDVNQIPALRTVIRFGKPSSPSVDTLRAPEDSERLVLRAMRLAMDSSIKFTAAAGVITASGTCLFGTSTYDSPTLAALHATPPPAAPSGLRVIP